MPETIRPMPGEAGILEFLQLCDSFYPADAVDASIGQQRLWYDALCAQFERRMPDGMTAEDCPIGTVPTRRYRPADVRTSTKLLYLHGGGYVVGSLSSHHSICAEIADAAGAELIAVDYRLAPEHVWPVQTDDCFTVLKLLLGDGETVVLIGDSAGGNLAAGLTLRARDEGLDGIVGQVLIYPALGGDLVSGSYQEMADAPGLTTADVAYYRAILKAPADEPVAHPLLTRTCAGLPPAYITVAHFDPLRDDGRLYAGRLAADGVEVWFREEPQMVHAWLRARHMSNGAQAGFRAVCIAVSRFADTL
ncbi:MULTISPECIES: alpha/beta hydrolase [Rhizobium]|uniref:Alpha/beta hydrolase n=1 Tax=Rhizobium rhododendri TaxID=2506430 RepID=A0ABY8ITG8_9HYPH|nr:MULTISPECIES: alpha/beta hydrolase [Rhizobium]MBZ5759508.1 alpha/beta hydrolase [Rhizobium sp. VS19-DR96]MBZ5765759.1 alpha/beta hydrolase [Rhizobium sp. VS19-DR129.2]MBZ5773843.1 alpha/beta hydrolase [Rhizobium sp. VS19-DRK62.2]MBZ5784915.1 alpha/beta hydrolase [Rhizobium sp. VS19-DR121]MBZ5802008.1 alpha/beta hydrolase [Rhizobium sp. VS19-DR181]